MRSADDIYEYKGSIHIHSNYSDGTGSIEDIALAGQEAGLDFLIITDHNTLRAKEEGCEKFYGNTLLLSGYEINDKENRNHYLALRVNRTFSTRISANEYVKQIQDAGGFGFIAHPHEKRNSMKEHPPYPWTAWDCEWIRGIEIWNHMSEWMENLTEQNKYDSFLHPLKSISAPPPETLAVWDKLNAENRVVGICGVDAHAHKVNIFGFFEVEVFPYKVLFKSLRTHILTGLKLTIQDNPEAIAKSSEIVLNCLEHGSCFVANDNVYDSTGFRFYAVCNGQAVMMGGIAKLSADPVQGGDETPGGKNWFVVKVPVDKATIKLIRNGSIAAVSEKLEERFEFNEEGVYRVEVIYNQKAWIFSNHIRIEK